MRPSNKFEIVEKEQVISSYFGEPTSFQPYWNIVRTSDSKIIRTFYDYLEALKYLEGLEDRYWLVS